MLFEDTTHLITLFHRIKLILIPRFRWVACQLDILCGIPTDAAKRKALDSLPPTLHETYERILERVSQSDQSIQKLVQRTLAWLRHGEHTLKIGALCEAISGKSIYLLQFPDFSDQIVTSISAISNTFH